MIDKRFHKGIELKNNLLYFKGINHLPHITDIIHGYNTILEENKRLMKENQELRMSPRVDVNEIESLVCENEKLKSEITTLKGGYDEYEEIIGELKAENEKLKEENKSWLKTASRMDTIHHEDREYCERIHRENEKLKSKLEESKKAHSNCDKLWWELHDEKEQLEKENQHLKSKINMLKVTIGRNEAHIKRLTEKSNWRTSAYD